MYVYRDFYTKKYICVYNEMVFISVILLPAHPASFTHNFVSGVQSFYFRESQDAMVMQTCHGE